MKHLFTKTALVISALALLCCCAQYEAPQISELPDLPVRDNEPAPDSVFANRFELTRIAERTLGISANSRGSELQISEIADSAGNPALYIMQSGIDNGFVIASARKSYWPVLAYCEEGSFDQESEIPAPIKEWLDNMTLEVSQSASTALDQANIAEWSLYERHFSANHNELHQSRTYENPGEGYEDEFYSLSHMINDSIMSWQSQGYNAGYLYDFRGISEDLREQWIREVQGGIYPLYMDDWMYLSAVRVGGSSYANHTGFELNYKWNQSYPFNQSFPIITDNRRALVGCANIAMGIVMRYHQWPNTFNWNDMPYNSATETTSKFLYDIAISNQSSFGVTATSTVFPKIHDSLNHKYGYNAETYDKFDYRVLELNLQAFKPVICTYKYTNSEGDPDGHAWVVSGTSMALSSTNVELWYFSGKKCLDRQQATGSSNYGPRMYYVNWGWGGAYNGYFRDLQKAYPLNSSAETGPMEIEIYPNK